MDNTHRARDGLELLLTLLVVEVLPPMIQVSSHVHTYRGSTILMS